MSSSHGSERTSCWGQDGQLMRLELSHFQGSIDQSNPEAGIVGLSWMNSSFEGKLLGITAGEETTVGQAFTRANDLIVPCASQGPQPFQWQVYWRAVSLGDRITQMDLIVSLQTPTLESFPRFATSTTLPAVEAWSIPTNGHSPQKQEPPFSSSEHKPDLHCILLRNQEASWSYAEMAAPEDRATTNLDRASDQDVALQRSFGGEFLEKGVIRRMRIRGVFLPREDDLNVGAKLFERFCKEEPPLTT